MDIIIGILLIALYVLFIVIAPLFIGVILLLYLGWWIVHTKNPRRRALALLGFAAVVMILAYIIWLELHTPV